MEEVVLEWVLVEKAAAVVVWVNLEVGELAKRAEREQATAEQEAVATGAEFEIASEKPCVFFIVENYRPRFI